KKHSRLSSKAYGKMRKLNLPEEAPDRKELRDGKQIAREYAEEAFHEDREELIDFVHDVYLGYVEYCLGRNYLNFSFVLMFAFALLCENHELRERLSFDYVMIDEFQDTNEIQLKIGMLLCKGGNMAVVGDWKQSIYSFQYTSVDNILEFGDRLGRFKEDLNSDVERIDYKIDPGKITDIEFVENYRSTQEILDKAENSLVMPGTDKPENDESLDRKEVKDMIVSLKSNNDFPGEVGKFSAEEEAEAVLSKMQELVDNPKYQVEDEESRREGSTREIGYSDIAVLTRTQSFALELQKLARDKKIPVAYEGGVRLFQTQPAILLLAWLRILNWEHSRKGWSVVLERADYTLDEVQKMLEKEGYPEDMLRFREELDGEENIAAVARRVFNRYGISNGFSDKVIQVLQSVLETSYMNMGELISFMEDNIEEGETYEVDNSTDRDMATVQTIHSAKGLEYPVVFVSDVNDHRFPSRQGNSSKIAYRDPVGIRQKQVYRDEPFPYSYHNWTNSILTYCVENRGYDEERRLFYVAMTRAENYLYITATQGKESPFYKIGLEELEVEDTEIEEEPEKDIDRNVLHAPGPRTRAPLKLAVHSIMDTEDRDTKSSEGRGLEFGTKVHLFAENYIKGRPCTPESRDERNVKRFIDNLEGEKRSEVSVLLPLQTPQRRFTLSGTIDLLHITEDKVQIVDFKTDRDRALEEEYRKQLSVYYHALAGIERFEDKEISMEILYTEKGDLVSFDSVPLEKIKSLF
ncbi:MAG: ATP-dependent DNA helicase, partial [Candidatus Nanohaloarchaea archaeon]|nr:ATP-dependent DNA helicase [Candidatus Nanohaloarchaea archaeon]